MTGNLTLIKLEASLPYYPWPSQTAKKCLCDVLRILGVKINES
jgi:hypothetical protein